MTGQKMCKKDLLSSAIEGERKRRERERERERGLVPQCPTNSD
jgi:hypothetical protein